MNRSPITLFYQYDQLALRIVKNIAYFRQEIGLARSDASRYGITGMG